jgi:hypothetical protein
MRTKSEFGALLPRSKRKGGVEWSDACLVVDAAIYRAPAPNKAPEPTPTSVTLRAIESYSEMKRRTEICFAARSAPAVVVAHL